MRGQQDWAGCGPGELVGDGLQVCERGRVDDADLAVLLHGALVLVVPSRSEGSCLPRLEAVAAGTPVLTSDTPALVKVAGGAALAVPLADLVAALVTICEGKSLRAWLRLPCPLRAEGQTWDGAARSFRTAYAGLG